MISKAPAASTAIKGRANRVVRPAELRNHRVLLVNDDGIHAEGLALLEAMMREFTDDVWIVAPDEEKSGASHSISLSTPLRCRQLGDRKFAVKGTPADCVMMAVWQLMIETPPTVVISGINHGENLGDDNIYSGTTGAAMESAVLGFRSIALSQARTLGKVPRLDAARAFAPAILETLLTCPWEYGTIANVNFPDVEVRNVRGIEVTGLGNRRPGTFRPVPGSDGRNVPYYWVKVDYGATELVLGTDLAAVKSDAISITPLRVDMTARDLMPRFNDLFSKE